MNKIVALTNKVTLPAGVLYLIGFLLLAIVAGVLVFVANTNNLSLYPLLVALLMYTSFWYVDDRLVLHNMKIISGIGLLVSVVLILETEIWFAIGMTNFLAVLYFAFFLYPLKIDQIECPIKREYINFFSILFGLNILLFNLEYIMMVLGYDNSVLFHEYLHDLLELSVIILTIVTVGILLFRVIRFRGQDVELQGFNEQKGDVFSTLDTKKTGQQEVSDYLVAQKLVDVLENKQMYLESDFGVRKMNEVLGLGHQYHLSVITKHYFNMSFNELIAKYRTAYALKLLEREHNWSITSVAESCGFRSFTTFNKYFVHYVGVTASEYKDRLTSSE